MVCIRRSGESGLTQGVLFPLHYEQTIQGTISRFHILLANFWLSLTSAIFWAVTITVYHSGSYKSQSRTIMGSRDSLPSAVDLFGGQSGRL